MSAVATTPVRLASGMKTDSLLSLLTVQGCAHIIAPNGEQGYLTSIEREDGSGHSFNVKIQYHRSSQGSNLFWNANQIFYIRTQD